MLHKKKTVTQHTDLCQERVNDLHTQYVLQIHCAAHTQAAACRTVNDRKQNRYTTVLLLLLIDLEGNLSVM